MGIWVRDFRLLPGETLVWRVACHWSQGGVARGGCLGLTSHALIFEPSRFDALVGGESRRIPLGGIASASREPGGVPKSIFGGGMRARLRLDLLDGSQDLILVNTLGERLAQIQAVVANAQ
jgi:hypothetical protein